MSTISGLMLRQPDFAPFDLGRTLTQATNIQGGQLANQTSLVQLEELRRAQEEAAMARQFMAANAGQMVPGGGGGPLLASPALTTGGGGPMTQQTVVPGQPPGAPQPVPGGQDLSQFATGGMPGGLPGGAPPSTLGGLQPQQDPLQALMARSPGAALQVMQTRMKIQEQQLTWGLKSIEAVAQMTHGVKTKEDLDRVRAQMQQIAPQAAAQLPQFYSAEALEAFREKALGVKERQELKIKDLNAQSAAVQAQADVIKARLSGRSTDVDNQLRAMGVPPGQETPQQMKEALQAVEEGKVRVSAAHGSGQIKETQHGAAIINPRTGAVEYLRGPSGEAVHAPATQAEQSTATFANLAKKAHEGTVALETKGFQPGIWEKAAGTLPLGLGNYLTSEEARTYKTHVLDFAQAWLRKTSQGAVTPQEWQMVDELYFPQPGNSKAEVETKRKKREAVIQELEDESRKTGRTGGQAAPGGRQHAPSGGQPSAAPTSQGPATFDTADFAQWRRSTGKTGTPTAADVQAYFESKGLKRR